MMTFKLGGMIDALPNHDFCTSGRQGQLTLAWATRFGKYVGGASCRCPLAAIVTII